MAVEIYYFNQLMKEKKILSLIIVAIDFEKFIEYKLGIYYEVLF